MKFSSLFLTALFLFFSIVPCATAGENEKNNLNLLSEFQSEIDQYRNLANEPILPSLPPDMPMLTYEKDLDILQNGNGPAAILALKELGGASQTPEFLKKEVHATLGFIYLDQNRPKEALDEFALIEKDERFRERALFGIAWSLLEQEEYVKTIIVFEELLNNYPDGDYAPEAHSKIGYCYSRLLAYKYAVKSYQKALHLYNKQFLARKNLLHDVGRLAIFQRDFVFNNSNPEWKHFFKEIKNDRKGAAFLKEAEYFFDLDEQIKKTPAFRQSSSQNSQFLSEERTKIGSRFQRFVQEQLEGMLKISEDLSTETAVEMVRIMAMEQSLPRPNSGIR